jgi:hypothetical protein
VTLSEWAIKQGLTDRQIAENMTLWIGANRDGNVPPVSFQAVQKYRTRQVPRGDRMSAINAITEGAVTANDFYVLPAGASDARI